MSQNQVISLLIDIWIFWVKTSLKYFKFLFFHLFWGQHVAISGSYHKIFKNFLDKHLVNCKSGSHQLWNRKFHHLSSYWDFYNRIVLYFFSKMHLYHLFWYSSPTLFMKNDFRHDFGIKVCFVLKKLLFLGLSDRFSSLSARCQ